MRLHHRGWLARVWCYTKILIILLAGVVVLAVYLVDEEDDITAHVRVPREKVGVDLDLSNSQEVIFPRTGMRHQDVVVLLEDLAVLRPRNRLILPTCPPGVMLNKDDAPLERLKLCSGRDWDKSSLPPQLLVWDYTKDYTCEGKLTTYHNDVMLLKDVIVDKAFCSGRPCHDDKDPHRHAQPDDVTLDEGFFLVPCGGYIKAERLFFRGGRENHLNTWVRATIKYEYPQDLLVEALVENLTIAVNRSEPGDIYRGMADLYNAFAATTFFNVTPSDVNVIFIDAHARRGDAFDLWDSCFGDVKFLSETAEQTLYRQLFWNKVGDDSELLVHSEPSLPLSEEFSKFLLRSNNINEPGRLDCDRVKVTLVSHRHYANRTIGRQIANEQQLLESLPKAMKNIELKLVRLEELTVREQIEVVSSTDVLMGMHGAGLTHALVLPPHGALLEFLPHVDVWSGADGHFRAVATWRNLTYVRWRNDDLNNEINKGVSTEIPIKVALEKLQEVISAMCHT